MLPMKKYKIVVSKTFPELSPAAKERKIVKQLEEMKTKGQIPYIPSDL